MPRRPDDPHSRAAGEHLAFVVEPRERVRVEAVCATSGFETRWQADRLYVRVFDGLSIELLF